MGPFITIGIIARLAHMVFSESIGIFACGFLHMHHIYFATLCALASHLCCPKLQGLPVVLHEKLAVGSKLAQCHTFDPIALLS
jgi:hypothetical protein